MTEPTTAAGRAHWALHAESRVSLAGILAIEAEARAAALDEARAAIWGQLAGDYGEWTMKPLRDVFAAIDALREGADAS